MTNFKKCEVLVFNFSKKIAFPPDLKLGELHIIKEATSTKVVGVILESNLKFKMNTNEMFFKAATKLWLLRRLKFLSIETEILTDFYVKEIRVLVEYAPVVFNDIF